MGKVMQLMIGYFVLINIIAFAAFGIDKWKAVHQKYRISEATLFLLALIGGSAGALCGMYAFHHKTRVWYFKIGIPLILILQIAAGLHFVYLGG